MALARLTPGMVQRNWIAFSKSGLELTLIKMLSKTKKVVTTPPPVLCSVASCKLFYSTMQRVETLSLLFVPPAEGGGMEIKMFFQKSENKPIALKLNHEGSNAITFPFNCGDDELDYCIQAYLNGEINIKECILCLLSHITDYSCQQIKANEYILDLIEKILENATWKTYPFDATRDYRPYSQFAYTFLIFYGQNETYTELISRFKSKGFLPLDAINLIHENWKCLYPLKCTYELILSCFFSSENYTHSPEIVSMVMALGNTLGPIYQQLRKTDDSNLTW